MHFRFDWSGKKPLLNNEKVSLLTQSIRSGTAHAIFMWWDLNMDTDNQVINTSIYYFLNLFMNFSHVSFNYSCC